jgi:hypothetical protein
MDDISIQEPYVHLWLFIKKLTPSNSAVAAVSTEPLATDSEASRVDTRPKYHHGDSVPYIPRMAVWVYMRAGREEEPFQSPSIRPHLRAGDQQ